MTRLANIVRAHVLNIISYTDTQLIFSEDSTTRTNFQNCMTSIATWMKENCLKLNQDKTEVQIFSNKNVPWDTSWWASELWPTPIPRNLSIILNSNLSMKSQVNAVASTCFYILRMLHKILKWLPQNSRRIITQALISRLN